MKPPTHEPFGSGAVGSFEQVVNAYYQALYRFAFSLARNEAEAGDLTQQTFYIWAKKGDQLRDPSKAKTWLFTTLYREFTRVRRKQKRFPQQDLESAEGELPVVAPSVVDQLDARAVVDALRRLDLMFQAPLALFYLEEESYQSIAEILDLPLGTVQSRIARGKKQLYRVLADAAGAHAASKEAAS